MAIDQGAEQPVDAQRPVATRRIHRKAVQTNQAEPRADSNPSQAPVQDLTEESEPNRNRSSTSAVPLNSSKQANDSSREIATPQLSSSSSPFLQSLPTWMLAVASIATYSLTVCYAFGTPKLRYISFASPVPSHTIAVIRILSEVTAFLLVPLISLCTERILWMLIRKRHGARFSTFLALHPSSGVWSWIQLLLRNASGARTWSCLKMLFAILIPTMGVALLSQVETQLYFNDHATFNVAAGVGAFNATYVDEYAEIVATLMATDFSSLLQTQQVAWNTPVVESDKIDCVQSDVFSSNACGRGYFIYGGFRTVTPWPILNKTLPSNLVYTLHSVRGIQLDFTSMPAGARFEGDSDCIVVGDNNGAVQICISQFADNAINAKYVHCPLLLFGSCLKDSSWLASSGWTATMTSYTRTATAHVSRSNTTTIDVSDMSPATPYQLSATDILSIYNTTFTTKTSLGGVNTAAQQFIYFLFTYLRLAESSSPTAAQALFTLHNLMAMPLYYFQPTYLSPYTTVPSPDRALDTLPRDQGLYVTASLSTAYYGLTIASWSAWTYAVGMGLVLLVCILILILSSLPQTAAGIPDTTAWSFVDFAADCHLVKDGEDQDMHVAMQALKHKPGFKGKAKAMQGMRMRIAGKKGSSLVTGTNTGAKEQSKITTVAATDLEQT